MSPPLPEWARDVLLDLHFTRAEVNAPPEPLTPQEQSEWLVSGPPVFSSRPGRKMDVLLLSEILDEVWHKPIASTAA